MTLTKKTNYFILFLFLTQLAMSVFWSFLMQRVAMSMAMQMIATQLLMFVPPMVVWFYLQPQEFPQALRLKPISLQNILLALALGVAVQPAMYLLSAISMLLFPNQVSAVMEQLNQTPAWLALLAMAVVPAGCEESVFRGVVLSGYRGMSRWKRYFACGLMFGLMHFDGQQFLYAFAAGVFFSFLAERSGSLFFPILTHFTINGMQTMQALALSQVQTEAAAESVTIGQTLLPLLGLFVFTLPILLLLLFLFVRHNPKRVEMYVSAEVSGKERLINLPFWGIWLVYALLVILPLFL